MNIKISIIIPIYNSEDYLGECLDSLLMQTFKDFEIILVNEYGSDLCVPILEEYCQKDDRIRYIQNAEKLGLSASLNVGIENAKGDYIARMDADDIALPNRLQVQYEFMESSKDVDICSSNMYHFKGDKVITSTSNYPLWDELIKAYLLFTCSICHPTVMFRKSTVDKLNIRYNESFKATEDYELWVRLSPFVKFHTIKQPLLLYRDHENNATNVNANLGYDLFITLMKNNFLNFGITLSDEQARLIFWPTSDITQNKKKKLKILNNCYRKIKEADISYIPKKELKMALDRHIGWAKPGIHHSIADILEYFEIEKLDTCAHFFRKVLYFDGILEFLKRKYKKDI